MKKLKEQLDIYKKAKSESEACAEFIKAMQDKKKRQDVIMEGAKARALRLVEESGNAEFDWSDVSVKLKRLPVSLGSVNEDEVPQEYFVEQKPKLDRRKLLTDAKQKDIPGCTLSNGGYTLEITFRNLVDE